MVSQPIFISIEGPNGVGKSTVLETVVDLLRKNGHDVLGTKEPTDSELGRFCRRMEEQLDGRSYACLIAADRHNHVEREITPALMAGKSVVSDRYLESSLVLQRIDGVEMDFIWRLHAELPKPYLSLILIASPHVLAARLAERKQRLSRFERITEREVEVRFYMEAAAFLKERGYNVVIIDASRTLAKVQEDVGGIVASAL